MHFDAPVAQAHSEMSNPGDAEARRQRADPAPLLRINRVDRIDSSRGGAHLYHQWGPIVDNEVDLSAAQRSVSGDDVEAPLLEPLGGDGLAQPSQLRPPISQMEISVFSSFSTLTSRKVRTWTCSKKRAGRNMSQTHASDMVTSK